MTRSKKLVISLLAGFLLLAVIVNNVPAFSAEELSRWIESLGPLAPVLYIAIYALRPLIFFPASILTLTGGILFGAWFGTLYTLIGATLSAIVGYFMAERLRALWGKGVPGTRLAAAQKQMETNGFLYVLWFRLVPFLNFDVVSYVAGAARVKWIPYITATILGMLPGTIAYNFLGGSLLDGDWRVISAAVIVVILFTLASWLLKNRMAKKSDGGGDL